MATTRAFVALTSVVLLSASACSSDQANFGLTSEGTPTTAEPSTATEASTTSTTDATTTAAEPSTTTQASTTSTAATTSTAVVSERAQAEAEIRQVVTDWYEFLIDTSKGEEGLNLDGTTGLLRRRLVESAERRTAQGQIVRATTPSPIEIAQVRISLEEGTAEADACTGSTYEYLDAETLEVIATDDPSITLTSLFQLRLVEGEWKITEWISSDVAGDPKPCEIQK
jgi:hypothetical protein